MHSSDREFSLEELVAAISELQKRRDPRPEPAGERDSRPQHAAEVDRDLTE